MADDLSKARQAIERQITELEGQVTRLRGALAYIEEVDGAKLSTAPTTAVQPRQRVPRKAKVSGVSRAPRGQRQAEFLAVVEKHPGATASFIASEMGVTPNQVHGLAHRLTRSGKIHRQRGGGYTLK